MGQSKRATKCKRSTGRSKSLVFYKYHKSVWLHILLRNSRCHCRSYGKSTYCQCDPIHYRVTFVSSLQLDENKAPLCGAEKNLKQKKNTKKILKH